MMPTSGSDFVEVAGTSGAAEDRAAFDLEAVFVITIGADSLASLPRNRERTFYGVSQRFSAAAVVSWVFCFR